MNKNHSKRSALEHVERPIDKLRTIVESIPAASECGSKVLKRAAVSAVFFERADRGLELLFIQRASDPRDPWSGHMAFPGGRVETHDAGTRGAAERETLEEIGLDLPSTSDWFGRISDVRALAKGRLLPLVITPHVYRIRKKPALSFNYEVDDAVWVPFSFLLDDANREEMDYKVAGIPVQLPCFRFAGKVIWGLTLRMVDEILGDWTRSA